MNIKFKRLLSVLFILVLISSLISGCSSSQDSGEGDKQSTKGTDTIKVGIVLPLSGPLSAIGENLKMAHNFAVKEINESGGIKSLGGAKLELIYGDSQGDPKIAATETERLIMQKGVVAMMDAFQSSCTYTGSEVAERYETPYLCPSSSMDEITERGFKYTFRLIRPASLWAQEQIRFLSEMSSGDNKVKRIALVYENTDQGQSTAKGWKKFASEAGFEVVLDEAYSRETADFMPLITKIKNLKPDAILMVSYISDAIQLQKLFKENELNALAYVGSSSGHSDPSFVREVGDLAEYLFDLTEWASDLSHTPLVQEKNEAYKKSNSDHREFNGAAAYRYAGTYVLADAIERAGSTDRKAIREALANTHITEGPATILPYSPIEFDEKGQAKDTVMVMVQYLNGKRTTIWPESVASEKPVFPMPKWSERK